MFNKDEVMHLKLCIIGAGYVGLPLAMAFSEKFDTTVCMQSQEHVDQLKSGVDRTDNFSKDELLESTLTITSGIKQADIYVVTVPTPVDKNKKPDLSHIKDATRSVASVLKEGDIVKPGQLIGYVGSSGYGKEGTSGKFPPHLHFGFYKFDGRREWSFNPYRFLRKWKRIKYKR